MKSRRPAFTLIEILAAIAIITILLGLLFHIFNPCGTSSREKKTHVLLKTLQGMLTEFESQAGHPELLTDQYATLGNQETMPQGVIPEDFANPTPQLSAALQRTQTVMLALAAIPQNRSILDKLPPEVFMRDPAIRQLKGGPILLDAWNRPILFAPGRTSSGPGINQWGATGMTLSNDPRAKPANSSFQPPDGKAMFISAGADTEFSKGDDNLYSFEK